MGKKNLPIGWQFYHQFDGLKKFNYWVVKYHHFNSDLYASPLVSTSLLAKLGHDGLCHHLHPNRGAPGERSVPAANSLAGEGGGRTSLDDVVGGRVTKEFNLRLLTVLLSFGVGPLVASPPASEPSWSEGTETAAHELSAERCSPSRSHHTGALPAKTLVPH
jgi:hypothetical protein